MSHKSKLLYHVSSVKFDTIKSKAMLIPGHSSLREYDRRVSLLLTYITPEEIRRYAKRGFKRWNMPEAYIYTIDPTKIIDYDYANLQSTPEQVNYDKSHWDDTMQGVSDSDFPAARKQYDLLRDEYLRREHNIPSRATVMEYVNHPLYKSWSSHDWIKYNLEHGNKDQYASYTPHMQIAINQPLEFEEVIKLI